MTMAQRTRILFVDDELLVLAGLGRMLRSQRQEWQMSFVQGGQEALDTLAVESSDVIVSDIRMPGIDGAKLLTEARKQYPHILRIALSGQANEETVMRTVGAAHQYLSKPCEAGSLKSTLTRGSSMRVLLASDELREAVAQWSRCRACAACSAI